MRLELALLCCLIFGGLACAQTNACSVCPKPESGPFNQKRDVCLSSEQLAAQVLTRKLIGSPALNEPHMNSQGTVVTCLCFEQSGKVTDVRILSGPAMMLQLCWNL